MVDLVTFSAFASGIVDRQANGPDFASFTDSFIIWSFAPSRAPLVGPVPPVTPMYRAGTRVATEAYLLFYRSMAG